MEKFMFIFKGADYEDARLSAEEAQKETAKWYSWIKDLSEKKIYEGGEPLIKGGKILKKNGGKVVVTDGPFPESKELVGGFFVVKAEDMNGALEIAKDYPDFDLGGTVEIRQVRKIDMM